jgi:4'-phosphopantetheinyl transferase
MTIVHWQTPLVFPLLEPEEVHLWFVELNRTPADMFISLLSESEKANASRLVKISDQNRCIISYGILRILLGKYLTLPPKAIDYFYGPHGKPYVVSNQNARDLQFNISHSGNALLYGFSLGAEVGVDVEYIRKDVQVKSIAERFFSVREIKQLQHLDASDLAYGFYRCWTRKEAFLKVTGLGLSFSLKKFSVDISSFCTDCLLEVEGAPKDQWRLCSILEEHDYIAALAVKKEVQRLSGWISTPQYFLLS